MAQPGASGTFNAQIPPSPACGNETSHLRSKVDCVRVTPGSPPGTADLTAHVTESSGEFTGYGPEISISVSDAGSSDDPDGEVFANTTGPCSFTTSAGDVFLADRGNFTVRSGA
jgi:hypothetical protein